MKKKTFARLLVTSGFLQRFTNLQQSADRNGYELLTYDKANALPSLDSNDYLLIQFNHLQDLPVGAVLRGIAESRLQKHQLIFVYGEQVLLRNMQHNQITDLLSEAGLQIAFNLANPIAAAWRDFAKHESVLSAYHWTNHLLYMPFEPPLHYIYRELSGQWSVFERVQRELVDIQGLIRAEGLFSSEADDLLDSMNSLMLVKSVLDLRMSDFPTTEAPEYAAIIGHSISKFRMQLIRVQLLHYPELVLTALLEQGQPSKETDCFNIQCAFAFPVKLRWELPENELKDPLYKLKLLVLQSVLSTLPFQEVNTLALARLRVGKYQDATCWRFEIDLPISNHSIRVQHNHRPLTSRNSLNVEALLQSWAGVRIKRTSSVQNTSLVLELQDVPVYT